MRRFVAVLCLALAMSAHASSFFSEITDLWYTPGEDGWGVNIVLQNNVAFATFYVYDVNRNPVWFTAVLGYSTGFVFSGSLFADRGPWYGGPFDPATVTERQAGTATFTLTDSNNATLTYTIDGITIVKALQRLTFTNENYSGTYAGGFSLMDTACTPPYVNGLEENLGLLTVNQTGATISLATSHAVSTCTFNGTYSQNGKLGAVDGTYSCLSGANGVFSLFEMTPTTSGFLARATGHSQNCQWSGFAGGIRRAQ